MKRLYLILILLIAVSFASRADRKDIMDRKFITPTRIVWTGGSVKDAEALLLEGSGQAAMIGGRMCEMVTTPGDTASVILDYGKELHGGLKLVMAGYERYPKLVRIRFGESVSETCSEVCDTDWIAGHSTDDHAMRDIVMKIPRDGSIELGNTGFRFVRIDLLETGCTLEIREATAILRWRDIPYQGSFRCSDKRLDSIWQTGAWTTHLNMQEYIWDGIKRDRLIWLGDMHPEMATVAAVFGYNDVIDRSVDMACEQFPLPGWLNGMSSYSMWYLVILHDWYMQNGNLDYVRRHHDYITGLLDLYDGLTGEDGSINIGGRIFLDWPSSPNQEGVRAGYRALLCLALEDASRLCDTLGDEKYASLATEIRSRLLKAVEPHNNLKQSAALMAIAGLMPAGQACEEVVSAGGAQGFSTFYGYYMLEALAMAGRYQEAVDIIRQFWGGMLDMGATSFWEDFNLSWMDNAFRIDEMPVAGKKDIHGDFGDYCYLSFRHSLCHGWASGPTPWMSHHILGVRILEPGCRKVCIEPHLGDLEWAEGTYPTPYGNIAVKVSRDEKGRTVARVESPREVQIEAGEGVILK